jgi:hypothetical protein
MLEYAFRGVDFTPQSSVFFKETMLSMGKSALNEED